MKQSDTIMLIMILVIGISAIAIYLFLSAMASIYMRLSDHERARQLGVGEPTRLHLSDDPSMLSPTLSMAERERNIEVMVKRLEAGQP